MKEYLIPMPPKRLKMLVDGKITKEVKLNCPRGAVPIKCYVYCPGWKYENKRMYAHAMQDTDNEYAYWKGKVVAEFICDEIRPVPQLPPLKFFDETKLTSVEYETLRRAPTRMRTLNIKNLNVYKNPRPLTDFTKPDGTEIDNINGAFTPVFLPVQS